jgi:6,7-dimethyl-8-ribityllumazine synthase
MKIGIVVSETYWEEITSVMLDLAITTAKEHSAETEVVKVPGSFDIPLAAQWLAKKDDIDGVVTLGAVIRGETTHDETIMNAIAPALIQVSLETNKPVVLGVNGGQMTKGKGIQRIGRAKEVTEACIKLLQ